MIYVIAPSFAVFDRWCQDNMVSPRSPLVVLVRRPEDVMGKQLHRVGDAIVDLGSNHSEMKRLLETRRRLKG